MTPRPYDSLAMARIGIQAATFCAEMDEIIERLRLHRKLMTDVAAWRLIQRFVGPGCPSDALDALTCVGLMGAEIVKIYIPNDGSEVFQIRRGEEILDFEEVPQWK